MNNPDEPDCISGDFTTEVDIEQLNDLPCEVCFRADSDGDICVNSIKVLNRQFSATECAAWFGAEEYAAIEKVIQDWWSDFGADEAEQDAIAARADDANDERMED